MALTHLSQFEALTGPDELKSASGTFNDSSDEVVDDFKKANDAAKNDDAPKEIGATDCVSKNG